MNLVIIGVALISSSVADAFTHTANMPLRHPVALATCSTGAAAARRSTKTTLRMVASPDKGGGMVVEGPFEGKFGSWIVDEADAAEVLIYRGSLVAAALAVAAGATMALLPDAAGLDAAPDWAFDAAAAAFFASFGVSVATIHIYMKPMHNFLKVLWAAGAMGAVLVLVASPSHSLVVDSFQKPELLLASGWVFVALTGLFFKEFACFQRWEASALFAILPVLTGGHFLHILPGGLEATLLGVFAFVFPFFALRKFDQPLNSDIGDKTIFQYFERVETGQMTPQDMEVARSMGMVRDE
mmetsp:Transcript_54042/g.87462  ORF Transcript_54042/g.87462 Transcript_54042/m.87462 type:complete len:298 (+) Transcript_54042:1-894(+)